MKALQFELVIELVNFDESFAYGRIGYDNYSDGELIIACKESGLEFALKEAGVIE